MRDILDRSFAEEYLTGKLHEIDTALERIDHFPDVASDLDTRRRLTQLKAQLAAAVEEFPPRQAGRQASG
jgi:hypothetical protein